MVDPLGTDDAEEVSSGKPNFIGRIVGSEKESDEFGVKEEYIGADESREDYYEHLYEIAPLVKLDRESGEWVEAGWDNLHEFSLKINTNPSSKWMVFMAHLESAVGDVREYIAEQTGNEVGDVSIADLEDALTGEVFEFRELTWTEDEDIEFKGGEITRNLQMLGKQFGDGGNLPNPLTVPVRRITDADTLADLGVEQEPDADETVQLG